MDRRGGGNDRNGGEGCAQAHDKGGEIVKLCYTQIQGGSSDESRKT